MRRSVGGLLFVASLLIAGALLAQTPATKTSITASPTSPPPSPPQQLAQATKPQPAPAQTAQTKCDNPNAIGLARTVEIDTTGAPGFGFEHFKNHDFLKNGEVVLTFDDGPWPGNTEKVLKTLAEHCIKATF